MIITKTMILTIKVMTIEITKTVITIMIRMMIIIMMIMVIAIITFRFQPLMYTPHACLPVSAFLFSVYNGERPIDDNVP